MRERLKDMIAEANVEWLNKEYDHETDKSISEYVADFLLANGVIVPPCKVGDTLYVISQMKDKRMLPFINQYDVTSITIKKKSVVIYHEMDGYIKIFKHTDFGETVFLTREEAEQALEKMKGGE
jgi:hypothetical protein